MPDDIFSNPPRGCKTIDLRSGRVIADGGTMPEVTNPANYCCDNGNFGEPHECQKQPGATPAPSQPAGAREWLTRANMAKAIQRREDNTYIEFTRRDVIDLMEAYAREQTAAKDAEIDDLRRQRDLEWDSRKAAQSGRIAAEHERDSLREALVDVSDKVQRLKMYQPVGIAQFRRALREAIDAAEAALKSGRE